MKKLVMFVVFFVVISSLVFGGFHNYNEKHWEVWRWSMVSIDELGRSGDTGVHLSAYMRASIAALKDAEPHLEDIESWETLRTLHLYDFFYYLKLEIKGEDWEQDLWPFAVSVLEDNPELFQGIQPTDEIDYLTYHQYHENYDRAFKERLLGSMVFIYQVIGQTFPELYENSDILKAVNTAEFQPIDIITRVDEQYADHKNPIITMAKELGALYDE